MEWYREFMKEKKPTLNRLGGLYYLALLWCISMSCFNFYLSYKHLKISRLIEDRELRDNHRFFAEKQELKSGGYLLGTAMLLIFRKDILKYAD